MYTNAKFKRNRSKYSTLIHLLILGHEIDMKLSELLQKYLQLTD